MQQTNVRVSPFNGFAVEFKNQTKHAMRRRMLRPKIHGVVANFSHVASR
jgi:hypothetical protein